FTYLRIDFASSSETEPAIIRSSPGFQLTGVATRWLAVRCRDNSARVCHVFVLVPSPVRPYAATPLFDKRGCDRRSLGLPLDPPPTYVRPLGNSSILRTLVALEP